MSPVTANLLLVIAGGPTVMGGTFLVARALVLRQDKQQMSPEVAERKPAPRRVETTRPPQRKELTAR